MNWPVKNVTVCISNVLYCFTVNHNFYGWTLYPPNTLRFYFINLIMRIHLAGLLATYGNIYLSTGVFELICYPWLPQQPYLRYRVCTKIFKLILDYFLTMWKTWGTLGKLKLYEIFKATKYIFYVKCIICQFNRPNYIYIYIVELWLN